VTAAAVILISFFALLWKVGLFDRNSTPTGAEVIGSVLGLLGVIVTAAISLIGYFLKQSFDEHSLRLQQATEDRLRLEGEQNRKRLDMETAIQAVGLMSTQSGTDAPVTQKSGALFALVTLDQIDLALALTDNLWAQQSFDSGTGVWVVDKALQSNLPRHQIEASTILGKYKTRLYTTANSIFWPECFYLKWSSDIDLRARNSVFVTLLDVLTGQAKDYWLPGSIWEIISILQNAITSETDLEIKAGAILVQNCLLKHFAKDYDPLSTLLTSKGATTLKEMMENLEAFKKEEGVEAKDAVSRYFLDMVQKIEKWSTTDDPPEDLGNVPQEKIKAK
jgi:hypothetical protein